MFKHANTLFPGDRVHGSGARQHTIEGKTAAMSTTGRIKSASQDGGSLRLEVEWDDGTVTWEDPNTLQKRG
jgi:hypothetical protein